MKKQPWIAAVLNFFLMGAGTLYNGRRKLTGIALTIGAVVLTYVEFGIQPLDTTLYWMMFAAILVVNTALAIDGYREASMINAETA